MGKGRNTSVAIAVWMLTALLAAPGFSQEAEAPPPPPKAEVPEAASLAELLQMVKQGYSTERKENQEREKRFAANKAEQQRLLAQAEATLTALERQSEELESTFQEPLLATVQGMTQLKAKTIEMLGDYLAENSIEMNASQLRKFHDKVKRWIEATPEDQVLVLKIGTLSNEPYSSYKKKER